MKYEDKINFLKEKLTLQIHSFAWKKFARTNSSEREDYIELKTETTDSGKWELDFFICCFHWNITHLITSNLYVRADTDDECTINHVLIMPTGSYYWSLFYSARASIDIL